MRCLVVIAWLAVGCSFTNGVAPGGDGPNSTNDGGPAGSDAATVPMIDVRAYAEWLTESSTKS